MADSRNENWDEGTEPEDCKASAPDGAGQPPRNGAAPAGQGGDAAAGSALPAVEGPKLGDGDPDMQDEEPAVTVPAFPLMAAGPDYGAQDAASRRFNGHSTDGAPQPRPYRFALVAAIIAVAAGVGSVAGSLTAAGFSHRAAAGATSKTADARDVIRALRTQAAELAALKRNIESASRSANSHFAKVNARVDSLRRTEAEHAAKLAQIAQSIDKLDSRGQPSPEFTGSIAASRPRPTPILNDWIVQEVHAGHALVESRYGRYFLVSAGNILPGVGRVETVERQGGHWIVRTARGIITTPR